MKFMEVDEVGKVNEVFDEEEDFLKMKFLRGNEILGCNVLRLDEVL